MFAFQYTPHSPPPTTALYYRREKFFDHVNPPTSPACLTSIPLSGKETFQQILQFLLTQSLAGAEEWRHVLELNRFLLSFIRS